MPFWYWLILAAVFGVVEVAMPAMVCIWFAAAAVGAAAIAWLAPALAWEHQALIFAALAIASVVFGRMAFAPAHTRPSGRPLNRRGESYVGRTFTLDGPIADGRGRLRIDDTVWLVAGPDLPAGSRVRITGVESAVLQVEGI
jgi:inner membrane protein